MGEVHQRDAARRGGIRTTGQPIVARGHAEMPAEAPREAADVLEPQRQGDLRGRFAAADQQFARPFALVAASATGQEPYSLVIELLEQTLRLPRQVEARRSRGVQCRGHLDGEVRNGGFLQYFNHMTAIRENLESHFEFS